VSNVVVLVVEKLVLSTYAVLVTNVVESWYAVVVANVVVLLVAKDVLSW
tara:strand:- start:40 stop:186 length:147 start_codon:yes stop_codon:yes gene_type:complete